VGNQTVTLNGFAHGTQFPLFLGSFLFQDSDSNLNGELASMLSTKAITHARPRYTLTHFVTLRACRREHIWNQSLRKQLVRGKRGFRELQGGLAHKQASIYLLQAGADTLSWHARQSY
jgi:hypothetical protein